MARTAAPVGIMPSSPWAERQQRPAPRARTPCRHAQKGTWPSAYGFMWSAWSPGQRVNMGAHSICIAERSRNTK